MDGARTLTMSAKELDRLEVLGRVVERRLTQWQAAEQLSKRIARPVAAAALQTPTPRADTRGVGIKLPGS